ncbi:tubulin-specific chaperone A [Geosmithia morbida]|uniref:Tubulin-specific chaperone A n=1 Tax=Geosmithia morbida TaxID=1094350 RepID=A0A9P4YVQ9_9HYPO|nr:tubulin-specific chaperone A [Geosmithia morbida]KAF4123981.1 tubulin-specific chaperone A [Geosmithia morbida]
MPAPSQLAIATSSVLRLLKEELSYHKELVDQEAKVKVLSEKIKAGPKSEDGNDEFMLKQEKLAVEQTQAIFEPLKSRISQAVSKLEEQLAIGKDSGAPANELEQAQAVLDQAKVINGSS